jgi:molecular chaperone GrpE
MAHPDPDAPTPTPEAAPAPGSQNASFLDAADRIRAIEAERDEFRDRWMRAEAEMQNLRTRTKREVDETRQYAVQKFARDVTEAAENLRRGIDTLPAARPDEPDIVTKVREGFEGIERSFIALLERNGITTEEPLGKMFDANLHQAMAEQPSDEHPAGTILQAWSRGWLLNGRLLRPAMVVVAKGRAAAPTAASIDTTA